MKKFKLVHPTEKMLIFILILIIGLMSALIAFFGWRINLLENTLYGYGNSNQQQVTGLSWVPIRLQIQDAVKGVYSLETVTDPNQQKVYIPEARIYLPLSNSSRSLVYNHFEADGSEPAQFSFNTSQNLNQLPKNFDEVPCLQRVAGFSVNNSEKRYEGEPAGNLKLADGRTLYFWKNTAKCERGEAYDSTSMVNLLKQAKSY